MSYNITTYVDYTDIPTDISDLDLSALNPSSEKQHITMTLLESGQINMVIEEKDFDKKIKIKHHISFDKISKIVKTQIIGNSIKAYGVNDKLISSETIELPNQIELVNEIKNMGKDYGQNEIDQIITTMQGQNFIDNLEEFIANASQNGVQVIEQGEFFATLRMPLSKIDARIKEETVLLIDKRINKLVGTRIYSEDNKLLQSTYYAYNKGETKSLKAIKVVQLLSLPSGNEIEMVSNSKIENLKIKINI